MTIEERIKKLTSNYRNVEVAVRYVGGDATCEAIIYDGTIVNPRKTVAKVLHARCERFDDMNSAMEDVLNRVDEILPGMLKAWAQRDLRVQ